jgi:hypothetical protein
MYAVRPPRMTCAPSHSVAGRAREDDLIEGIAVLYVSMRIGSVRRSQVSGGDSNAHKTHGARVSRTGKLSGKASVRLTSIESRGGKMCFLACSGCDVIAPQHHQKKSASASSNYNILVSGIFSKSASMVCLHFGLDRLCSHAIGLRSMLQSSQYGMASNQR